METEREVWEELSNIPAEPLAMRLHCEQCRRPRSVCWCWALPAERLRPRGRVVLLQHPAERRRALQTARVLQLALAPGRCLLYRGKRFPHAAHERDPQQPPLGAVLAQPATLLLYPTADAIDIQEAAAAVGADEYNLVIVDGTWPQAKAMVASSAALRGARAVRLPPARASRYVVRSQPALGCLSTLECAAEALATLERSPRYRDALLRPLRALCEYQLSRGAVPHHALDATPAAPKLIGRRLARLLNPADDTRVLL